MLGGLDTVTATLDCMITYLAPHPDRRQAILDDPELIPVAVEELLRHQTPVMMVPRKIVQDVEIGGVMCRAGDTATLLIGAGNIDARRVRRRRRGPLRPRPQPPRRVRRRTAPLPRLPSRAPRAARRARAVPPPHPRVLDPRRRRDQLLPRHPPGGAPPPHLPGPTRLSPRVRSGHGTGRIPRHDRALPLGVDAVVAGAATRAGGRAQRRAVVLDDVGFAQLGCFGSDLDTPDLRPPRRRRAALPQLPHDRAVLADALVPAHRAQPPRERHGPHHRPRDRLPRLRRAHPQGESGSSPRCSCRTATRRSRSASGTSRPTTRAHLARAARSLAARPRLRALLRVPRRRDAPVRAGARARQPLRRRRRVRSRTATTSPRTSPTTRSSSSPTCATSTPTSRSSSTSAPGACHSPHQAPPEWIERYRGRFDAGLGRVARADASPARQAAGLLPEQTVLSERPDWVPGVGRPRPTTSSASTRASWRRSPGYLSHTDHQIGRVLDVLATTGDLDDTLVVARAPTTARAARAASPARSTTPGSGTSRRARVEEAVARHRRDRRPALAQQLPVGLDRGRQHAVPPLEARGPRRRRRRSAASCRGRAASRRRAGSATSTCTRSTSARPCSSSSGIDADRDRSTAISFAETFARHPTRPTATACSTSRCSAAARSTTTAGRP